MSLCKEMLVTVKSMEAIDRDIAVQYAKTWDDEDLDALVSSDDEAAFPLYRKLMDLTRDEA